MRENKFRAYNELDGEMIYSSNKDDEYVFDLENGTVRCCVKQFTHDICGDEYIELHNLENIMQYVGLKDNTGTEIYEGDIVLHESRNYVSADPYCNYSDVELREYFIYDEEEDVYYEEECTYMKVEYDNEKAMYILTDVCNGDNYDFHYDFESCDVKIVGNIYENDYMY